MAQATNPKRAKSKGSADKIKPTNRPVVNPNEGGNKAFMAAIGVILLVGALGIARVATQREATNFDGEQVAAVEFEGEDLPASPGNVSADPSTDPAIGSPMPRISGTDFSENPVVIEDDGRAKAIYYLAHWCPHCQEEVPNVVKLDEEGRKPDNLDVYAINTSVDAARGNYPPARWLDLEDFTFPVIRDDALGTAFQRSGGSGFPYVIYVDADNNIVARSSGTLNETAIEELWNFAATGGAAPQDVETESFTELDEDGNPVDVDG